MVKHIQASVEINGIPARDLTDEEFSALPKVLQSIAIDRGIYAIVDDAAEAAKAVAEAKPKRK